MKRLISHFERYLLECILCPAFQVGEAVLELMVPLIMADLIDNGIALSDTHYVEHMSLDLVFHGFAALFCALFAQFFAVRASVGVTADLKHSLFSHIQALSNSDLDRIGTSTLVTRLTADVDRLQSALRRILRGLISSPFLVIGAAVMAFRVDRPISAVFFAVIPLMALVIFGIMYLTRPLHHTIREQTDALLSHLRENLSGVRVMRAFCREEKEGEEFSRASASLTDNQKREGRFSLLSSPICHLMINLAIVILLHIGALEVDGGRLTQGEVVALYNYLTLTLVGLTQLAALTVSLNRAAASAKRIGSLLDEPSSIVGAQTDPIENPAAPAIEFRDVSLCYSRAARASLSSLSLRIERGMTVGIVGSTGSGKSTLANLINRGYDVTSGAVLVNGADVRSYPLSSLRAKIGMVPQHPTLFRGTVRSNLLWGNPDATEEQMLTALEAAGTTSLITQSEKGLDAPIAQGGRNLSGGQRQRLTVARALVRRPEILILDDSTSALDRRTAKQLHRAVFSLDYDPTVLCITRHTAPIRDADLILVLEEGEPVGIGKHEDLLATCAVYREICESEPSAEEEEA